MILFYSEVLSSSHLRMNSWEVIATWNTLAYIEQQILAIKFGLFLVSWYSQELAHSLAWYFLTMFEVILFTLQLVVAVPFHNHGTGYVDTWGSVFAVPSLLPSYVTLILCYIVVYHWWWRRPSWKPGTVTWLYSIILFLAGAYWCVMLELTWIAILVSVIVGLGYGLLTCLLVHYVIVPEVYPQIVKAFGDQSVVVTLMGSKNTLINISEKT